MRDIPGLEEYIKSEKYRERLGLPKEKTEEYRLLAQGEYNRNYVFTHPVTGQKLLLRVNFGSQMHLENQIEYEFSALKLLESSGRTPRAYFAEGKELENGVMVMEFLEGHHLDYKSELMLAADCLADIHSVALPKNHSLITPENPVKAILDECIEMFEKYRKWEKADGKTEKMISEMLEKGMRAADRNLDGLYKCCVNTELNSTNFLINGEGRKNYLVDWEKPVCSTPAQDLGHFLAPTTTFWKTDVILTKEQTKDFIKRYISAPNGRFDTCGIEEQTMLYIPVTCLRGITWCAMATVEYSGERAILNETTAKKLKAYLSGDFLEYIDGFIGENL